MPLSGRDRTEEAAYAAVLEELRNGVRDEPLMAKAYAEAEGDDNKARARYLRYRSAKLLQAMRKESAPGNGSSPPAWWRNGAGRPRRSWSRPRSYDVLLILGLLLVLFLFNSDVHRAVLRLLRSLGLHPA